MRAFLRTAYSLGGVFVDVFHDDFISGGFVNLGNGYDLGRLIKCFGFLENRFVQSHAKYK